MLGDAPTDQILTKIKLVCPTRGVQAAFLEASRLVMSQFNEEQADRRKALREVIHALQKELGV
jgi:hypothetical protein